MNILITLCGRGGSKGIPGKNIKMLNGKPLLAYSIDHAQQFAQNRKSVDIALSTDDAEIISIANEYGLNTEYVRPDYLANDTVGKIDVLNDILNYQEASLKKTYDILLDLDITSPLRTQKDLDDGLDKLLADKEALNLFSVSKPHKNPYFNVVEVDEEGYCRLVKPSDSRSRQSAPLVYDMNASFYFYRKLFFENGLNSAITERSLLFLMDHVCFDLDEPIDFDIMEYLLAHNKITL
ncbi:cytidylyltransferase domain-containing protein [Pricia sp.]|uniref:acylneuraminate cytidylyltransferase family protein n=1 Tax=Pricia sp. TaxID=2268138 RepID=UPI0035932F7D